jgi:Terpene cyclase DEP1
MRALSLAGRVRFVVFVLLAVVGAVLTARFNAQFSATRGGFDLGEYVKAGYANSASTSFTIDITIAAIAGLIFMIVEGRRLRMRSTVPLIVSTFVLAFAFSFPMFLALRELKLARETKRADFA